VRAAGADMELKAILLPSGVIGLGISIAVGEAPRRAPSNKRMQPTSASDPRCVVNEPPMAAQWNVG
jgi:hypothetical protein